MQVTISFQAATVADFAAALKIAKEFNLQPEAIVQPERIAPLPGGNRPVTPLSEYYQVKTGERFRLRPAEAAALGWQGALKDCPQDIREKAIVARLLAEGETQEFIDSLTGKVKEAEPLEDIDVPEVGDLSEME